eukprot:494361-Prymnesium_polylepis.1
MAQRLADALNLACVAGSADTWYFAGLSLGGALACGSLLALPAFAIGLVETRVPLLSLLMLVIASGVRINHLLKAEGAGRRPHDAVEAATALCLVPEAILRWSLLTPGYITISGPELDNSALTLMVGSLPSPAT